MKCIKNKYICKIQYKVYDLQSKRKGHNEVGGNDVIMKLAENRPYFTKITILRKTAVLNFALDTSILIHKSIRFY